MRPASLTAVRETVSKAFAIVIWVVVCCSAASKQLPHYRFILPDGYTGWIQVIFNDASAKALALKGRSLVLEIPDAGIFRTSSLRYHFVGTRDEFLYRRACEPGVRCEPMPVPADYLEADLGGPGFGLNDTCGRGAGYSWFIFVGPPDLRGQVPYADWARYVDEYQKQHGTRRVVWTGSCPVPGRLNSAHADDKLMRPTSP